MSLYRILIKKFAYIKPDGIEGIIIINIYLWPVWQCWHSTTQDQGATWGPNQWGGIHGKMDQWGIKSTPAGDAF